VMRLMTPPGVFRPISDTWLLADTLEREPLRPGARVLDLGCGSGELTATVADLCAPGGRVLGTDVSASQIAYAASRHERPGLSFAVAAAQDLGGLLDPESFDVVLSVAALHWVPGEDQAQVLDGVRRVLRPGGVLRIDMGGQGQIARAREVLAPVAVAHGGDPALLPWFFPGPDEYRALLTGAGLEAERVELVRQRRPFRDAAALEGWLRSQVLPAYDAAVPPDGADRASFTAAAVAAGVNGLRRDDGSYDQDYVRLDVLARRP
jgi:SAM-dependent methyltransferase